MRLSDAGLRRHQTKLPYPNHRLPPWLTEDAAPLSLEPIVMRLLPRRHTHKLDTRVGYHHCARFILCEKRNGRSTTFFLNGLTKHNASVEVAEPIFTPMRQLTVDTILVRQLAHFVCMIWRTMYWLPALRIRGVLKTGVGRRGACAAT